MFLALLRRETAQDPERRAAALKGLRRYQDAPRAAQRNQKPAVATAGRASLRDYGGWGVPVVFVPSLINPPHILDLARGNSLLRWLARQGAHPYLVDWGTPSPDEHAMDVTDHVEQLLLPLLDHFPRPPVVVGYCLGGTMALAAACARPVAGLGLIAAPWHFAGFADARADMTTLWRQTQPVCSRLGLVPMEVLQAGFWQIDPRRTVAKYEQFARTPRRSAEATAFVTLEDWANDGAPLTYAAGRQLFEDFQRDDIPGRGQWRVGGVPVDPASISCPTIEFVSKNDRIVPAATSARLPGNRTISLGHVGMIVGGRARGALWEPIAEWITARHSSR